MHFPQEYPPASTRHPPQALVWSFPQAAWKYEPLRGCLPGAAGESLLRYLEHLLALILHWPWCLQACFSQSFSSLYQAAFCFFLSTFRQRKGASTLTVGLSHVLHGSVGADWYRLSPAQGRPSLSSQMLPLQTIPTPTPPNPWHIQAIQCPLVFSKQLYFLILHSIYSFNLLDYYKYYLQLWWF